VPAKLELLRDGRVSGTVSVRVGERLEVVEVVGNYVSHAVVGHGLGDDTWLRVESLRWKWDSLSRFDRREWKSAFRQLSLRPVRWSRHRARRHVENLVRLPEAPPTAKNVSVTQTAIPPRACGHFPHRDEPVLFGNLQHHPGLQGLSAAKQSSVGLVNCMPAFGRTIKPAGKLIERVTRLDGVRACSV